MKKICFMCLALIMCICLSSCQSTEPTPTPTVPATHTSPITATTPTNTTPSTTPEKTSTIIHHAPQNIGCKITKKLDGILVGETYVTQNGDITLITYHIISDEFDKWAVGDFIDVEYTQSEQSDEDSPIIIYASHICETMWDKPIIYLYPETPTKCSVKINFNGSLTCTYPDYGENGWKDLTAYPDGTLIFPDGKEYYALYWEGTQDVDWDFSQGFCVKGEDTAEFLEWALEKQGLTKREANEFIIYWLPRMQDNPYNVISFQTDVYTDGAALEIDPKPDSLLRVFMAYYPSSTEVDIAPQEFEGFDRQGFTVVEWGGSEVKK